MAVTISGDTGISAVQTGAVESGDLPAGSVIQVVAMPTNTEVVTTTSTSFVDITGYNLTITPQSSANKIVLLKTSMVNIQDDSNFIDVSIFRSINGSSFVNLEETPGNPDGFSGLGSFSGITGTDIHTASVICHIDSPSTTLSVEYKVNCKSRSGGQVRFNPDRYTSTFVAMEIAG